MHIDWTLRIGDVAVAGFLAFVAFGLKKTFTAITGFVSRVDDHGELIDEHSRILERKGLTEGKLPRVAGSDHVTLAFVLALLLPAPLAAQDAFPLASAQIVNAPDVSSWPQAATITRLTFAGGETSVQFTKQWTPDRWPDVVPPGWDGPLQYTLWLFLQVDGHWVGSGFIQFWHGRLSTGSRDDPDVPSVFDQHWYYAPRWRPLHGHGPIRPGESIGFMVTSGNARDGVGPYGPMERSNVVVVPAADVADYTFAGAPPAPPPVVPPPVVIVPPAPPVPPPVPPVVVQPPDLSSINAQLARLVEIETDTNAQVRALNKSFAETVGRAMAFIGKYIAPAVTAFIAARML